ncbi:MAG: RNA polymerase sigma factor [Mycobacteriales bacterium]
MTTARAGVSAEAFSAVIAAYADRVHDDVRRLGCEPAEAAEIVESSALRLLDDVRLRPERVGDLVGGWFRAARMLAERIVVVGAAERSADPDAAGGAPTGLVRRSEDDAVARAALAELNERDRMALLLRDAYDLPYSATAVALGVDEPTAARLVARARLRFLSATGADTTSVSGHDPELAALGRVVDRAATPTEVSAVRRHSGECRTCPAVEGEMVEARRLLSGLGIVALPDAERDAILARVSARAAERLPSAAALAGAQRRPLDPRLRRRAIFAGLILALVGGSIVGILTAGNSDGDPSGLVFEEPSESPSPTDSGSPTGSLTASATATSASASAAASNGASRSPSADEGPTDRPPPAGEAAVVLSRTTGPNNATITVVGSNWVPGSAVAVDYVDPLGRRTGSSARATADPSGGFSVQLVTHDPDNLPGPHRVVASNDTQSASATYTATT